MSDPIDQYRRLRDEVDRTCAKLEEQHWIHLQCQPRCTQCCINLTVFPVEFFAIRQAIDAGEIAFDEDAPCGFLADGLCAIYEHRPIICRTHGLPLAFADPDAAPPAYSVTFCPRNFTDAEDDDLAFGPESTLDLDATNVRLVEINRRFVEAHPELGLSPSQRIPLRELIDSPAARHGEL